MRDRNQKQSLDRYMNIQHSEHIPLLLRKETVTQFEESAWLIYH